MGKDRFYRKVAGTGADFTEQVVVLKGALTATATPMSVINPYGVDMIIEKLIIDVTSLTTSTPNTIDVGVSTPVTASSDTLMDGVSVGTGVGSVGLLNSEDNKGTNGAMSRKWLTGAYVKISMTSTPTGFAGNYYIYCRKA
jgi:hypothetical protein